MPKLLTAALFVTMIALGAVLTVLEFTPLMQARKMQVWPTVEGTVVVSEIVGERAIHPLIVYQYKVGDSTYQSESSLHAPMFGGKRKKYDVADELVSRHPVGSAVVVFYNPDSAAQSTLAPGVEWSIYGRLGLGILLCLFGLFGLGRFVRGLMAPGKYPSEPTSPSSNIV